MTTGLVLGKFAPLHKGHQRLIELALAENDHVIVMIYDAPEFTTIPLTRRAGWIERLYPGIQLINAWDGPMEVGDTPEIKAVHEKYLLKMLASQKITRFYSSEFYGEHVSKALGAVDRRVDPQRLAIPVSATQIRNDPFSNRHFLDPMVYWDLIAKVVFLGAPSTGKTTLAKELASIHQTIWMPEYGREYWDAHQRDRRLSLEQLVEIAQGHRQREEKMIVDAKGIFFVDTDATTTYHFSHYYHGTAHPKLVEMANDTIYRYDLFFLCGDDIPYDNTWDRSGEANRNVMQQQISADLLARKIPFISLNGPLQERIRKVNSVLNHFDMHQSLADQLLSISIATGEV